jgi:trigger factor
MQATIETISELERRIALTVPKNDVEQEVKKRLNKLSKTAKMPGFRPGKVPMKIIAEQYGAQVRNDVMIDQINERFNEAMRDQDIQMVGSPRVEPKAANEGDDDHFNFSATFEVYPDVKLGDVAAVTLVKPMVIVDESDVDRTLNVLRQQRATYLPVNRSAQDGDQVVCDFVGRLDGVPFDGGQGNDFPIVLGEKRMLPEFEEAIAGMKAGETKTFPLTFPENYHGKEVAGKTAEFDITVKEVSEPKVPELDETFARSLGVADGSVDELRAEVKKNLELQLKHRLENLMKDQVMAAMGKVVETALPKAMVEDEMQSMAARMREELKRQGMTENEIRFSPESFRDRAEERVKLLLGVREAVRANNLQAKKEQVQALIAEVAETYEDPQAVIRWHLDNPERMANYEALATEHNIVEWMQAVATIDEKPMTMEAAMNPSLTFVKEEKTEGGAAA